MSAVIRILLFVAASLSLLPGEANATEFKLEGYNGDKTRASQCDAGSYVVGFSGRKGSWIDQIGVLCAPALTDGTTGKTKSMVRLGGSGGKGAKSSCDEGEVVTGIQMVFVTGPGTIQGIRFTCSSLATGQSHKPAFMGSYDNTDPGNRLRQDCPAGEAVTRLKVTYGSHVNAIGLTCNALVLTDPPLPPFDQAKPKLGFTGSWNTVSSGGGTYVLVLDVTNGEVTGEFTNPNHPEFSGRLHGTVDGKGKEFTYTYKQNNGAQGSGLFRLSDDRMTISGSVASNGQRNTWTGQRM